MSDLLWQQRAYTQTIYEFEITRDMNYPVRLRDGESERIHIIFEDGQFARVEHGLQQPYTVDSWRILRAIGHKVVELQQQQKERQ